MKMTAEEIAGVFKLLAAYYPGDWPEERNLVWAEAFQDLTFLEARTAVVRLGRTSKYASVAEFLECVAEERAEELRRTRGLFMPGAGWIPPVLSTPAAPREEAPEQIQRLRAVLGGAVKHIDDELKRR